MLIAVFNRIFNENSKDSEPYIFEFKSPIEFTLKDDIISDNKYNIKIDGSKMLPPGQFYDIVLDNIISLYKEGKLDSCYIYDKNKKLIDER